MGCRVFPCRAITLVSCAPTPWMCRVFPCREIALVSCALTPWMYRVFSCRAIALSFFPARPAPWMCRVFPCRAITLVSCAPTPWMCRVFFPATQLPCFFPARLMPFSAPLRPPFLFSPQARQHLCNILIQADGLRADSFRAHGFARIQARTRRLGILRHRPPCKPGTMDVPGVSLPRNHPVFFLRA